MSNDNGRDVGAEPNSHPPLPDGLVEQPVPPVFGESAPPPIAADATVGSAPTGPAPLVPAPKKSKLATAALVLGIVAVVFAVIPGLSFLAWLPALAAVGLGIATIASKSVMRKGKGISGVVLGGLAFLVAIVVSVAFSDHWLRQTRSRSPRRRMSRQRTDPRPPQRRSPRPKQRPSRRRRHRQRRLPWRYRCQRMPSTAAPGTRFCRSHRRTAPGSRG